MFTFESVTDLFKYCNEVAKTDSRLSSLAVVGEISEFNPAASGHCYFSLKDDSGSLVNCVMFRSSYMRLASKPNKGDKVTVMGAATFYAGNGRFQIVCNNITKVGQGDIRDQLNQLVKKLASEGLFDEEHKKSLPRFPKRIGVITSSDGAVIHDIINTLNRRNPYFDLLLYPAHVQGPECPGDFIAGLDYFEDRNNVDVIIIARGGGSIEDLMGFNDENLARRIFVCNIPIISAVGHETNKSISDFVADVRALTPTAAAEIVMESYDSLAREVYEKRINLNNAIDNYIQNTKNRFLILKNHKALHSPEYTVSIQKEKLSALRARLADLMMQKCNNEKQRTVKIIDSLSMLGPANVLKRGFSYVILGQETINSVSQLDVGTNIDIAFQDGVAKANILEVIKNEGK